MSIVAIRGERKTVNRALMGYALTHPPAIIIDCGNCANLHNYFPEFPDADYNAVYVLELELLYKYRDTLLEVHNLAKTRGVKTVVVTSAAHMMHYGDSNENLEMYSHVWDVLAELSLLYDVAVAVDDDSHFAFAQKRKVRVVSAEEFMGHTIWSQRQNLEHIIAELNRYSRALRPNEREIVNSLLKAPMRHVGSISYANSMHAWSFLLLSIIMEQEKRLRVVEEHARTLDRRVQEQEHHSVVVQDSG